MGRTITLTSMLAIGLLTGSAVGVAAQDTPPSPSVTSSTAGIGPIAYMRPDEDGLCQVWTSCPDMRQPRQLTADAWRNGWPAWAPDGTRLAFNSDRDDPARVADAEGAIWDIVTMDPDGGDRVKLTDSVGMSADPRYSRDGRLIAFGWDAPGLAGIYVMDAADGGDERRIIEAPDGSIDLGPRFSPDGSELMFVRVADVGTDGVFIVGLDGSGLRRVTDAALDVHSADWSSDGSLITFRSEVPGARGGDVWLIAPDGTGLTRLPEPPPMPGVVKGILRPHLLPGRILLLVTHGLFHDDGRVTSGLATMGLDGSDLRYIGDGLDEGEKMDWSRAGDC